MPIFAGLKIDILPAAIEIERSWTERLFSLPWRPLQSTKIIPNPLFTDGKCYQIGDTLMMSDIQYDALRRGMAHDAGFLDKGPPNPIII